MPSSPAREASSPVSNPFNPGQDQIIEADEDIDDVNDDVDSTLGPDAQSSTASITSSILNYRTIQGRTYHSDRGNALYWGSNDEAQSEAMDIIHHMWTLAQDGKLYLAPISQDIKKALDVGCGTGIWAIDFADEFPSCEVVGTDISPIQPSWIPPNLKFEIDDCTQDWTFTPDSYDYVHIRYLVGTIPDWTELFKQAHKTLQSGGYLESFEASPTIESDDDTVTPESAMGQWDQIFIEGSKTTGRTFTVIADNLQRKAMEEAGFVDIEEWNFKCPLSPWPKDPKLKEMGQFGQLFATQDTAGLLTFVASILGWSQERFLVYISQFRREIRDRRNHPYFRIKVLWGRKPEWPA
ncbi:S-adenosyl-L-methionine-dependent methyltransferase [Dactylonectria estremocensis]|uniref:S-adenosyl-L-methionine-dependent methyltransferase n=1 Tax=Dactylonectria estremocensis TaxID=1079267 RepID=A0A9P9IQU6_9HYPO|nr:S-adenosyl-L-methionine-dependent methyltransferase [Dactylonectria estremocensis]